jgi:hypothetical protein
MSYRFTIYQEGTMAQFHSTDDFIGSYQGSYDGRNASVSIASVISFNTVLRITFTDLDRNETYEGQWSAPEASPATHLLANSTLNQVGGSGQVSWSKLYLHTWNTSFLSGVSVWNNIEFGMSFTRV